MKNYFSFFFFFLTTFNTHVPFCQVTKENAYPYSLFGNEMIEEKAPELYCVLFLLSLGL